ncbi:protein kinase domain-containing protein [Gimesia fumaroli]|uniref:Serine/threonine-protein kinase StkP n=1 Tax=Gimesia fumaroli TaxID=2527976 RepID=A0A518I9W3_9PLAN|nr:protein kinase [Gimesia fumaroli]QDV49907.1 Serine/threonine-protein kinase StkP [Gimesia fumaroli]
MPNPECLSHEQLQALITADLPEQSADELFAHLESCADCRSALDAQYHPQNKNTRSPVLKPLDEEPIMKDPAFQRAVKQIEQFGSEDSIYIDHLAKDHQEKEREQLNLVGEQIDQYRIVAKLGEGGMGTVYKAVHTKLDKVVALKILPTGSHVSDERIARFEREMLSVGRLNHPHIVGATDAREIDGTHFLVMEYLDGIDLSHLVERMGPLPIADACEIIRQAAVGLQYAHQHDLIHRDIKPSNLMLTTDGQVKILDLGLALIQGDEPIEAQNGEPAEGELTSAGQIMGTLGYMAPEQIDHSHDVDIRADLYSLGCTFFKLLTGEVPFEHLSSTSVSERVKIQIKEPAPSILERRMELPDELAAIIDRLLAKSPGERYEDPGQLVQALESFTAGNNLRALAQKFSPSDNSQKSTQSGLWDSILPVEADSNSTLRSKPFWKISAIVVVLLLLAALVPLLTKNKDKIKLTPIDPDRLAAERVLTAGGIIELQTNSGTFEVFQVSQLPSEPFRIQTVHIGHRYLKTTPVPDDVLRSLSSLQDAFDLNFYSSGLSNRGLALLTDLPNLKYLTLSKNSISSAGLAHLVQFESLESLGLEYTHISDKGLRHLQKLPHLKDLRLDQTDITDRGLLNLKQHKNLETLSLRGTHVTNAGIQHLKEFPQLSYLTLQHTPITDEGLVGLQQFKALRTIELSGPLITPDGLGGLGDIPNLKSIALSDFKVTETLFSNLAQIKSLESLSLPADSEISDEWLYHLHSLPKLYRLRLGGEFLSDRGMEELSKLKNLQILTIYNSRITDTGLANIPQSADLREFKINSQSILTDRGLNEITKLKQLRVLHIKECKISDVGLADLHQLKRLQEIQITSSEITDACCEDLIKLPQLNVLMLYSTQITAEGAKKLVDGLPNCKVYLDSDWKTFSWLTSQTPTAQ